MVGVISLEELVDRTALFDEPPAPGSGTVHELAAPEPAVDVETETRECSGRLLSITKAPAFLENEDWMASARFANDLEETWEEWRDMIDQEEIEDVDVPPPA